MAWLLEELRAADAGEVIQTLLARNPASHVGVYDLQDVVRLAAELHAAGDTEAVQTLASRATEFADLDDPGYLAERLQGLARPALARQSGSRWPATPPACAFLDDSGDAAWAARGTACSRGRQGWQQTMTRA